MFGRATITLGIGSYSVSIFYDVIIISSSSINTTTSYVLQLHNMCVCVCVLSIDESFRGQKCGVALQPRRHSSSVGHVTEICGFLATTCQNFQKPSRAAATDMTYKAFVWERLDIDVRSH